MKEIHATNVTIITIMDVMTMITMRKMVVVTTMTMTMTMKENYLIVLHVKSVDTRTRVSVKNVEIIIRE